ncbi:hypothetical protein A2U01_0070741, partial [Trifolium medium]|nr:hypothetical protein [Trifolium medium]
MNNRKKTPISSLSGSWNQLYSPSSTDKEEAAQNESDENWLEGKHLEENLSSSLQKEENSSYPSEKEENSSS